MVGVQGTIRRRGFGPRLFRVGLLLVSLVAALPATASPAVVTEFPVPTLNSQPAGITVGPDGALWFTEENGHKIGRITTGGRITEYPIPTNPSSPAEITAGPDGNLWFTEFGANPPKVGRLTTAGAFTEWPLPDGSAPDGITAGPDGAIWFSENGTSKIGRITVDGTSITDYPLQGYQPGDITPGPDGRLWFTESGANKIGAITVDSTPEIKEYDLAPLADPSGIAASGGAMWFTEYGLDRIGRIPTFGLPVTEFGPTGSKPSGIALGPDGALWFTETVANKIGRMTTTGRITEFAIPTVGSGPGDIVAGPDGAMWFTEFDGNKIGRIEAGSTVFTPPPLSPSPPPAQSTANTPQSATKSACRVPRVRGLPVRKARRKMLRAGCRYRIRGRGRVVSIRPRAGARTRDTVQLRARRSRR
jgi:streptogramin lyase